MRNTPDPVTLRNVRDVSLIIAGGAFLVFLYRVIFPSANHTTVALSFLIVVLLASSSSLRSGVIASVLGLLCFNYFFIPPLHTFAIADPQNWVTLGVFLFTAMMASQWSSAVRRRAIEAERGREEVWKLYRLSTEIIGNANPDTAARLMVENIAEIFGINCCAIYLPVNEGRDWECVALQVTAGGNPDSWPIKGILKDTYDKGVTSSYYDGTQRLTYAPLKVGAHVTGILVLTSRGLQEGTAETLASLVALAIERSLFLKDLSKTEALRQSDELKSAILASVSHDLRTPLTSIRAAVDNLMEEQVNWDSTAIHEFHSIIKEEALRLTRLVENLLELARLESGHQAVTRERIDLRDLLEDTISICSAAVRSRSIRLDIQPESAKAFIDPALVSEVLVNLLENAAKYSPADSQIILRARKDEEKLTISVTDFGMGVDPDEQQRIFEKFYRSPNSTTDGTGLGLAVARGLVNAHNGEIWVAGAPGRGTTFAFSIPLVNERVIHDGTA